MRFHDTPTPTSRLCKVLSHHKGIKFYEFPTNRGMIITTSPEPLAGLGIGSYHYDSLNRCLRCVIGYSKDIKYCIKCHRQLRCCARHGSFKSRDRDAKRI